MDQRKLRAEPHLQSLVRAEELAGTEAKQNRGNPYAAF